jgi:signal transduction histidine kinase
MTPRNPWQRRAILLGMGWSLFWGAVLGDIPLIQPLNLWQNDRLIRLNRSPPPAEILLVPVSATDLKTWTTARQSSIYAQIADRLLDAGAKVVVLNLLPDWVQTADHADNPLKTLVREWGDRLVLVLPTTAVDQINPMMWRDYEYFLPTDHPSPESVLGFFEYDPGARNPTSARHPARQANPAGTFTFPRRTRTLSSFAWLALRKYRPHQLPTDAIQFHFWRESFPTLSPRVILSDRTLPPVKGKIVLVGFTDTRNPDAFPVRSPGGQLIPALEVQANLLASLLTGSFHRLLPRWLQYGAILLGGSALALWLTYGIRTPKALRDGRYWLCLLFGASFWVLFTIVIYGFGWLMPVSLPLVVWTATGLSVAIASRFRLQEERIQRQPAIEREAAIARTRKILRRVAAAIHEGPLQELKIIMDHLEILQMTGESTNLDPVIDRLGKLGRDLRQQLNRTRAITLAITPELKTGLDAGIRIKLAQFIESGELTVPVNRDLHPLAEPRWNPLWLEAREDIYTCFIEAIHNVVDHAQPPQVTAREVWISLQQHDRQCQLIIENDGVAIDPHCLQTSDGYGVKLMKTIASELPDGHLSIEALETGGICVTLSWTMAFEEDGENRQGESNHP